MSDAFETQAALMPSEWIAGALEKWNLQGVRVFGKIRVGASQNGWKVAIGDVEPLEMPHDALNENQQWVLAWKVAGAWNYRTQSAFSFSEIDREDTELSADLENELKKPWVEFDDVDKVQAECKLAIEALIKSYSMEWRQYHTGQTSGNPSKTELFYTLSLLRGAKSNVERGMPYRGLLLAIETGKQLERARLESSLTKAQGPKKGPPSPLASVVQAFLKRGHEEGQEPSPRALLKLMGGEQNPVEGKVKIKWVEFDYSKLPKIDWLTFAQIAKKAKQTLKNIGTK